MAQQKTHDRSDSVCRWTLDVVDDETWDTDCGEKFQFTVGTPQENGMRYCCYCGLPLQQKERSS